MRCAIVCQIDSQLQLKIPGKYNCQVCINCFGKQISRQEPVYAQGIAGTNICFSIQWESLYIMGRFQSFCFFYLTVAVIFKAFHRVIILNRGSMFAFQWREFSPPLSSTHRLLQCYHSQWEIGDATISGEFPLSPPPLGSLANERAVLFDVTLWRCKYWSRKFASLSSRSLARHAPSFSIMTLCSFH